MVNGRTVNIAVIMDTLKGHISVMTLNVNVAMIDILKLFGIATTVNPKTQESVK
jgi:hypothetical protein